MDVSRRKKGRQKKRRMDGIKDNSREIRIKRQKTGLFGSDWSFKKVGEDADEIEGVPLAAGGIESPAPTSTCSFFSCASCSANRASCLSFFSLSYAGL